jgi:membrane peptidoglycan carboxypeptidase
VRVLALNGLENFIDFAKKMGITTFTEPSNYGLSLTLGGGEVRPYDMAVAFGTFANQGIKQDLVAIKKVEDWKGKVLEEKDIEELTGDRVVEPGVTFIISHILLDNNARTAAFGPSSFLNVSGHPEVSVKTGTTNDRRDNWTIGYTELATVVSWVGNNDNSPMSGAVSGVSGASPIWNKIMKEVLDRAEDGSYSQEEEGHAWPRQPNSVVGATICSDTGNLPQGDEADPGCPTRFEYFLQSNVGAKIEAGQKDLQIDKTTGALAGPDTPPENIETQNHRFLIDPLGTLVCLDCAMPTWEAGIGYPVNYKPTNTQP